MRKKIRGFLMGAFVMAIWFSIFVAMFMVWAGHPAEQPITKAAYMETIGGEAR